MARMTAVGREGRLWVALEALVAVAVVAAVIGTSYGPAATVGFILVGTALAATAFFLARMLGALTDEGLDVPGRRLDEERIKLEAEKAILLQGIKEFEADAGVGKVDSADYEALRKTAERRAVEIIRVLKEDDQRWLHEAERLVAERTGKPMTVSLAKRPTPVAAPVAAAVGALFPVDRAVFTPVDGALSCGSCGRSNPSDARFCTGCGRERA